MVYLKLKHAVIALEHSLDIDENMYEFVDNDGVSCKTPLGDISVKVNAGENTYTLATFPNTEEGSQKAYLLVDTIWNQIHQNHDRKNICVEISEVLRSINKEERKHHA